MNRTIITTIFFVLALPLFAYASETNGTITAGFSATKICKDTTCSTYGNINWKPTINGNTPGATAVTVTDSGLSGNLWGDEIGWVNLSPTGSGVTMNASTGELSGYAYANTGGWINFRPTQVAGNPPVGVSINSVGEFVGYAYVSGLNGGWMKFDCASGSTCIKTDWRPLLNRYVPPAASNTVAGVVGLQYITQPIQPSTTTTITTITSTTTWWFPKPLPGKPQYPTKPTTYPGWVSSSTNPDLSGSTTTVIDIEGHPTTITISVRPRGSTSVGGGRSPVATSSSTQIDRSKEDLLAYKFIPERMKWRVPTSKVFPSVQAKTHVTIPDVDGTSLLLTIAAGAFLWKLGMIAVLFATRLWR